MRILSYRISVSLSAVLLIGNVAGANDSPSVPTLHQMTVSKVVASTGRVQGNEFSCIVDRASAASLEKAATSKPNDTLVLAVVKNSSNFCELVDARFQVLLPTADDRISTNLQKISPNESSVLGLGGSGVSGLGGSGSP